MTAETLLAEIKTRLSITGTYHDNMLTALTNDVKEYINDAGANAESVNAVGVIARGVADLWDFGSGKGTFSEVFKQRVIQLAYCGTTTKEDLEMRKLDELKKIIKGVTGEDSEATTIGEALRELADYYEPETVATPVAEDDGEEG